MTQAVIHAVRPLRFRTGAGRRTDRRAFSIIELLVVIGVIVVLAGLLVVALTRAGEGARIAKTRSLMQSMVQACEQYREDHGRYPTMSEPFQATLPGGGTTPDLSRPDAIYRLDAFLWFSVQAPVTQLVGDAEGVAAGFENSSRSLGPYLDIDDPDAIGVWNGEVDPDGYLVVQSADEVNIQPLSRRVILDAWGRPIRFFRHQHVEGFPDTLYTQDTLPSTALRTPTLADVVNLRPFDIPAGTAVTDGLADLNGDTTVPTALRTARVAFLSLGPDRLITPLQRVDENGYNRDNIVEYGP